MTTTRELLREILDDLEMEIYHVPIKKLRARLAKPEPEPEPVAWIGVKDLELLSKYDALVTKNHVAVQVPLFTKEQL